MAQQTLTEGLNALIRQKPVAQSDLESAALFVLDTLACAIGARQTRPAQILAKISPPKVDDVDKAAFYVGGVSHILEMDDLHRASVTHPGSVVIPAAWAFAHLCDLRGKAFLHAVLAGYEACTRVGMAVGKEHYRVWHNTATCGPFGSAMAVALLDKLDDTQTVWALGNAGTQSAGLWEFLSAGAMSKHLHTARGAQAGLMAARLAKEGFTGPARILEGEKGFFKGLCPDPDSSAVLRDADATWQLVQTSIKPWPCCRHTHPTIDAAIELHQLLSGAEIAKVEVGTYQAAIDVCDRPDPTEPYGARFSLQHCVAAALATGKVIAESFESEARARFADLRRRVTLGVDLQVDAGYPDAWGTVVTVETTDGRRLRTQRRECKGDPGNPVTPGDLRAKAQELIGTAGISNSEAARFIEAVFALLDDAPVRDLRLEELVV
ncbi:MmgE/PrpD family protein [Dongia rigui]|uniref:MmgE/PrpD family protein n=1 Tax=Dongia rigui TaxID=940149 RepID=A0ABU5E2Q3_9PROT|nr:MmgE/PrpD family protein [Dongia rigui]MDY0873816.1 MmgE/PrpD family protein [Dongia rigui]